ncbi:amidase domain-containing protein [Streptomyces massasporeus]|uniref:amidase domain-containing protein n=1 Tax=Streptomyces massasporeus TaxID=67324 RepID=UPI0036ED8D8B
MRCGGTRSNPAWGDIVFFDWNGKGIYDHAGVITKVKNGKAYVTAHNKNRLGKPLNEYLTGSNKGTDYSIIRVKPNWY